MSDPKTRREAEQDGSLERTYSADGTLRAYRDGDEHVVVSNGRDRSDQWTKRVPAERTHVAPGEHLWTIPDNWEQTYRIDHGDHHNPQRIYRIPETDVEVRVSVPHNNYLVDAWYGVQSVGESVVTFAGELDRDAARQALEDAEESGRHDDLVIKGLRGLVERDYRWDAFVSAFEESIAEYGPEALEPRGHHEVRRVTADGTDPWHDHYEIDYVLADAIGHTVENDMDVLRAIESLLQEPPSGSVSAAVPIYPEVTVKMDTSGVGADYHIQALVQAGCSPAEALDYYYVERVGMSQTAWAAERDCDQSTVSKNIRGAKRELKN